MQDLSQHILDIAENSLRAGAARIEISILRDRVNDLLRVEVADDGIGMDAATLAKVRDPFFTTKGKKTGLGIPLLAQAAEQSGGTLTIESAPGGGTRLAATFQWSNVDRPELGCITDTLMLLIGAHPEIDVVYEEREGARVFRFETRELKCELTDVPINAAASLAAIRRILDEHVKFEM